MFEIILTIFLGILAGIFTGLIPGIHINLISLILIDLITPLNILPFLAIIFIISMSLTHTFTDFIPSIFLGAPSEDSVLSVLPGHQQLLKGFGFHAMILTLKGSLIGILLTVILTPLILIFLPAIYPFIEKFMAIILISISIFMLYREKRILAILIFLLAGFLGFISLNIESQNTILPLLTGLFGTSSLIISIKNKTNIPKQKITPLKKINLPKKSKIKTILASLIASPLVSFLPGLGSSQSAVISQSFIKTNQKEFLYLLGIINTLVMGLSIIIYHTIKKTRTGSALAISQILPNLTTNQIIIIISTIIFAGILSFIITTKITKVISKNIHKINYSKISLITILFITLINIYFSGFFGSLILIASTSLGIFTIKNNIRRTNLMACLLIPSIIFYLF